MIFVPLLMSSIEMSPDILDKQIVELCRSICTIVNFGCQWHSDVANWKTILSVLVVKWPIISSYNWSRSHFQSLPIITVTPNFLQQQERIWNAKGSKSKRTEKKERGKSKVWLMHTDRIKILYSFAPNLWKIYLFREKK